MSSFHCLSILFIELRLNSALIVTRSRENHVLPSTDALHRFLLCSSLLSLLPLSILTPLSLQRGCTLAVFSFSFSIHRYRCGCSSAGCHINTSSLLTVHSFLVVVDRLTLLAARLTAGAHRTRLFTGQGEYTRLIVGIHRTRLFAGTERHYSLV